MKYVLLAILIYWIWSRFSRIARAVKEDDGRQGPDSDEFKGNQSSDKGPGEYVDFEEID